jgi:hypothetical protein
MGLRDIPRAAVGGYIKAVRWPVDRTVKALRGSGDTSGAEIVVDRADAAARGTAATVLGDEKLKQEAQRRSTAATERDRARKLRGAASAQAEAAEEQHEQREAQLEEQRQRAAQRAEAKREAAVKEKAEQEKKAKQAEQRRKRAAEKAAAKREEELESQAKRERLAALEKEKQALDEKDEAVVASDEAQRLQQATATAKEARKS